VAEFATAFFCFLGESMAGRITSIEVQKRNPHRANVYVDGEFVLGLAMIEALKLSKGQVLTDADIEGLRLADEKERAHEAALNFLSYRPRSEQEVRRRLQEKDYLPAAVDDAIARLLRAGLIDDEAFARYWIENREQHRPRGAYALRHELGQKGIESRIVDKLVEQVDEDANAYLAATKRLSRWQRLDPSVRRRRMSDYLRRRGFSYDVVQRVWERLIAEQLIDESETD
jgi:regulatory protein